MPKDVEKNVFQNLKIKEYGPMSAEATVVRNYLDWMIDLPWYKKDKVDIDLNNAIKLWTKITLVGKDKRRIIGLAVQKRMEKIKGPILCLIGPLVLENFIRKIVQSF